MNQYPKKLNAEKRLMLEIIRDKIDEELLKLFGSYKKHRIQTLERRFNMIGRILNGETYNAMERAYINVWREEYIDDIVPIMKDWQTVTHT